MANPRRQFSSRHAPGGSETDGCLELSVIATGETEEALSDFLFSEGASALLTEELPGDPPRILIRAGFPGSLPADSCVERIRRYQVALAALGFSGTDGRIEVRARPVENWEQISKEQFKPLRVGRRLTIVPPWHEEPRPADRVLIRIMPGLAFGTGYAVSTRMCLETLEALMHPRMEARAPRVLDVGTGTGILAIAAASLGARQVIAVDTDPQACAAARENLAISTFPDRVRIIRGGIEAAPSDPPFDLILANLDAPTISPLFPALARHLVPSGRLIVGGITVQEETILTAALRHSAFRIVEQRSEGEWLCFTLAIERR
jgi:ribosomal protein L11 methyltransferase